MNVFDRLNEFIRGSEASIVNLLSALAPWGAPLAPAWMSYHHMVVDLQYPVSVALAVALVVEVLGLSSISTILAFWSHNKRYRKDDRRAPVALAIFSFVSYLTVVIFVNVILDAFRLTGVDSEWGAVLAKALLNLLSVPAAIILAIRTQHKELIDGIQEEKLERRRIRTEQYSSSTVQVKPKQNKVQLRGGKKQYLNDLSSGAYKQKLAQAGLDDTPESIATLYGVSVRTAYRWRAK